MDRTEQSKLSTIAADLAATDPALARLLTDAPSRPAAGPDSARQDSGRQVDSGRHAGSALATATVGLMILVAGLVVSSSVLTVVGLVVMIVLPGPVAAGVFARWTWKRGSSSSG